MYIIVDSSTACLLSCFNRWCILPSFISLHAGFKEARLCEDKLQRLEVLAVEITVANSDVAARLLEWIDAFGKGDEDQEGKLDELLRCTDAAAVDEVLD